MSLVDNSLPVWAIALPVGSLARGLPEGSEVRLGFGDTSHPRGARR